MQYFTRAMLSEKGATVMKLTVLLMRCSLVILFYLASVVNSGIQRKHYGDFIQVNINGNDLDFSNELKSITPRATVDALVKVNKASGRRSEVVNPVVVANGIQYLRGISLNRLDNSSTVDCIFAIDMAMSGLFIIDSKNQQGDEFKICGPVVRRKKGFPWVRVSWDCKLIWSYSHSKVDFYGGHGDAEGKFKFPTSITSDRGDQIGRDPKLWITDTGNDRIVQCSYSSNGNMQWVNSIGEFRKPKDIVYVNDSEAPYLYVANSGGNSIIKVPVTDGNHRSYSTIPGSRSYWGDVGGTFFRPTGICTNTSGDIVNEFQNVRYVYVADAANRQIYQYLEHGNDLQFLKSYDLPPVTITEEMLDHVHVAIKSDQFGWLFVADQEQHNLVILSPDLEEIDKVGRQGSHSEDEIYFNRPTELHITGDDLYVVDKWGYHSGMQRFDIGGIEILSAEVDVVDNTLTMKVDNAFDFATYSINGGPGVNVEGLNYCGTSVINLEESLDQLANGEHTLTIMVKSAFSGFIPRYAMKVVKFHVSPNVYRIPRNVQMKSVGRKIDISWEPPHSPAGLHGYNVNIASDAAGAPSNNTYSLNGTEFTWYAPRTMPGTQYDINVGATYLEPVSFENNQNFTPTGNSLEHTGTQNAYAQSTQQLTADEWDNLPVGASWFTSFTFDSDPDELNLDHGSTNLLPNIKIQNTPFFISFVDLNGGPACILSGVGLSGSPIPLHKGMKISIIFEKKQYYTDMVFSEVLPDGQRNWRPLGSIPWGYNGFNFPIRVEYESQYEGLKLSDCGIGFPNAVSNAYSVQLRDAGIVDVKNELPLNFAVETAFNQDVIRVPDGEHYLSEPLNVIPESDNSITPCDLTIEGAGNRPKVIFSGDNGQLVSSDRANLAGNFAIRNLTIKSEESFKVVEGSTQLNSYDLNIDISNCIIDAPEIVLAKNSRTASGTINMNIQSSTLAARTADEFISLNGFNGLNLSMTDNFILVNGSSSRFCFYKMNGLFDLCAASSIIDNAFGYFSQCADCHSICTPGRNKITVVESDKQYLNRDYSVTHINHPAVILNNAGSISQIRGAIKTFNGADIASVSGPKIKYNPRMIPRTNPKANGDEIEYLMISGPSPVRIGLSGLGTVVIGQDENYQSSSEKDISHYKAYFEQEVLPGQVLYVYGRDTYGLDGKKYVLSFPGSTIFDEQNLDNFYGAKDGQSDVFKGKTSNDAASGNISWKIETLPVSGGGYETSRTETMYEPLPDVTKFEAMSFYYKKQSTDQTFEIKLIDAAGVEHKIKNTPLQAGERGWYVNESSPTTDWKQVTIHIKDEQGLSSSDLPLSGKLRQMSISFNCPTALGNVPSSLLIDDMKLLEQNFEIFDEQENSVFTGTGGIDGWDGLVSADALFGQKSFRIGINTGSTISSDSWTGQVAGGVGKPLPIITNKRKFTISYKKNSPSGRAFVKLYVQDTETNQETVFVISEQDNPTDMSAPGWAIPKFHDSRWHQVFIDLFSVRAAGYQAYPDNAYMPYGQIRKIELGFEGSEGSEVLYDNIRFLQDFNMSQIAGGDYSFTENIHCQVNNEGWEIKSLGDESVKNAVLSYGTDNNISVHLDFGHSSNNSSESEHFALYPKIEKSLSISGNDFNNTSILWKEEGYPSSYITLNIGCSNGETYPITMAPFGFRSVGAKGKFSTRSLQSQLPFSTTKHSYNIKTVFDECYPELVQGTNPILPQSVISMAVEYKPRSANDWFVNVNYPYIKLPLQNGAGLNLTLNEPVQSEVYGNLVPINFSADKELQKIKLVAAVNGVPLIANEQQVNDETMDYDGRFDLSRIEDFRLRNNGEVTIQIAATDVFGEEVVIERDIVLDRTMPSVSLERPLNNAIQNDRVFLKGTTDIPCVELQYSIKHNNTVISTGNIQFSSPVRSFEEYVDIDNSWPRSFVMEIVVRAENGQMTKIRKEVETNPRLSTDIVGNVINNISTWNGTHDKKQMCGTSTNFSGTNDNYNFDYVQIGSNFEATVRIVDFSRGISDATAGIMVRRSLDANAVQGYICLAADSTASFICRNAVGAPVEKIIAGELDVGSGMLKIKRIGPNLISYISHDNMFYSQVRQMNIGTGPLYVGLAFSSENDQSQGCALFDKMVIETFSESTGDIILGCYDERKLLPTIIQHGDAHYVEDKSTSNSGEPINISGTQYNTGIGGKPQSGGSASYLIYDLEQESKRLHVEKILSISGVGGCQNGSRSVTMAIKGSNTRSVPTVVDWITTAGGVNELWRTANGQSFAQIADIDLTAVKWLGLFISSDTLVENNHGVWGNIKAKFSGSADDKPPVILSHPSNQTTGAGESVTFTVSAEGSGTLEYRWQKNYMDIAGANSSSYTTPPLRLVDNGAVYRCIVSNTISSCVSQDAVITVNDQGLIPQIEHVLIGSGSNSSFACRFKVTGPGLMFNGDVSFGCEDSIRCEIKALGNLGVADRTYVGGNIEAGGTISLGNQVFVEGGVNGGQNVSFVGIKNLEVIPGSEDVRVEQYSTVDLQPGEYGDFEARNNSTIILNSGGVYKFKSFRLETDVVIKLNYNSGEKIELQIQDDINFGDRSRMITDGTGLPLATEIYTNGGNLLVGTDCELSGRYYAPNAQMDIRSRTTINGTCYAKTFIVQPDVTINCHTNQN